MRQERHRREARVTVAGLMVWLCLVLPACAPAATCLDLEALRGTAIASLPADEPACLTDGKTTLRFETATWPALQDQAREVTRIATLDLILSSIDFEPNNADSDETLLFLRDSDGRAYGFDAGSGRLRVIQPSTGGLPEMGLPLADDALRATALAYAASFAPVVLEDEEKWVYGEGAKAPIHFFDWTSTESIVPGQNPRRFQVALWLDGTLFSYMNYTGDE